MENFHFSLEWYAAFVKTGKEDNVKARLEFKFKDRLSFFVPRRRLRERKNGKWSDVIHILFPGYVLINGPIDIAMYYEFKNIPELVDLLSADNNLLPIPKIEMEMICRLIERGEEIGTSCIIKEGANIQVIDGPLKNMEGQIVKIDSRKGRAKVKMSFLGQDRIFDLAINFIGQA